MPSCSLTAGTNSRIRFPFSTFPFTAFVLLLLLFKDLLLFPIFPLSFPSRPSFEVDPEFSGEVRRFQTETRHFFHQEISATGKVVVRP